MLKDRNKTIQTFWVSIANLFSFSFALITSAILCRMLPIEQYGLYKQVIFIYTTLLVVFTLGIPRSYSFFLPKVNIHEAKDVVNKISRILLLMGILMGLVLFFCSTIIAQLLHNDALAFQLRIFSIVPMLMLPTMGIENILITYKLSKLNTIFVLSSKTVLLLAVILPVMFYRADCTSAVMGFVISSFLIAILALMLKDRPFKNIACIKSQSVQYKHIIKFSLPLMIAGIFGVLLQSADQFFVSRYFGVKTFAIYSNGALELPFVAMLTGATATVLLPYFTKEYHEGKLDLISSVFKTTILKSALLLYPLIVYCWVFAYDIMTFLYGTEYMNSAVFFRITSIINIFNILVFAPLLIAMGKVKHYAIAQVSVASLIYITDFLAISVFDISAIDVNIISLVYKILLVFIMFAIIKYALKLRIRQIIPMGRIAIIIVVSSILCFSSLFLVNLMNLTECITRLIIAFSFFIGLYLVFMYKPMKYSEILHSLKNSDGDF